MRFFEGLNNKVFILETIVMTVIGVYLLSNDYSTFIVFLIFVPFFSLMLKISTGNPILFCFSLYFYLAIGIANVLFWNNRGGYRRDGMMGIGNFNFSILSFVEMNSYVVVYFLTIFLILFVVGKITHVQLDWNIFATFKIPHKNSKQWLLAVMPLLIVVQIVMYSYGIAIHGVEPKELPLHLWGGFWYFRMLIIPIIIAFILVENDSLISWISIFLYIYVVSICSLSRTTIILSCIPVILLFREKKIYKMVLFLIYVCLCLKVSDMLRDVIYIAIQNNKWLSIFEIMEMSIKLLDIKAIMMSPIKVGEIVFQRMGGGFNIVQGGLIRTTFSLNDFIKYVIDGRLSEEMISRLEGIVHLKEIYGGYEGLEVGYGLSYLGCIVLTSQYNYLVAIIHALIVVVPIILMYVFLWHIRKSGRSIIFQAISYFVFIAGIVFFVFGGFDSFSVWQFYIFSIISIVVLWGIFWLHDKVKMLGIC